MGSRGRLVRHRSIVLRGADGTARRCSVAAAAGEVRAGGEHEEDGHEAEQQEFHWDGS
jgi:hypothetical protein